MKRERIIELWLAGFVLVAGLIVVVVLLGTAAADGPPMSERAHLSFSPIHNLLPTNTVYVFGHLSVAGNKIKKNNFVVDPLCNEQDGCYPYGDGCEERDYYCAGNGTGCNYTSSNRHNDSWMDTGNTQWVDENECEEKEQKEQEYRDYKCSEGSCNYRINDTKWVDTGIYNSTCNGVSLAPLEITSFTPLSYVDDTVYNRRTFNVTLNQAANVSWYLNDTLVLTNESVLEAKCTLLADVVGEHNVTAIASNANGSDMQTWIWDVTELELPTECEGTDTCCGSYPNCGNCNDQDGCYPHGDGCEERDYYCVGDEEGCNYTSSNRHNDSWVDTGNMRWVDVSECQEKEQKEQEYRDYECSAGSCNYSINDTKWIDTGIYNSTCNGVSLAPPEITSSAPLSYVDDTVGNGRTFNVMVNQAVNVSWYLNDMLVLTNESVVEAKCTLHADVVGEHNVTAIASNANGSDMQLWIWAVTELPKECEGTDTCCGIYPNCGNCTEQDGCYPHGDGCEERDYYCAGNGAGCNYTSSNRHNDSWVDTGNTRWVDVNECKQKEQKEQEYRDYECSAGSCNYTINNTKWLDTGNTSIKANGTICGCTANNTVKRCYDGNCTDTGIGNTSNCSADVAGDGKELNCTCGDICVIPTGWWRNGGGAFHPTDTPIQAAIDNAIAGETICVKDGTYTENVDVDTQLTIRSENGAASTTVNALYSNDHVFYVTADYVSISGFTVNGAIGSRKAGIYLDSNIGHCNIYDNNASANNYGIYLSWSSKYHTITGNTLSNNDVSGIRLTGSSNNTIADNTALNNNYGIFLDSSSSNVISDNTVSNNEYYGISLYSKSNNNLIYNNYFNNIRNNAQDEGTNSWDITPTLGENIIGGSWLGGNYWSDYNGIDTNGDGLGDTLLPYNANGDILVGGDMHPLVAAGIAPLLSLEKTDDPDPVQAGGTLNYSISVSNKGYVNASVVIVTETYDLNVTFDSAIPAPSSGNDMWIFPALNANETKLINISVTVNPLTAMGTVLHNTVTVSCAEGVTDTDTEATTVFSGEQNCTCGDICVITTGWWRNGSAFHPTDTPIQAAIDNAISGETICVKDGMYTENVDVDTQLTIRSENGAASTTVNALYSNDHVFEVIADYVSISGFTVKGATDFMKAGICLDSNIDHCNIYDNNASGNYDGIDLSHSSNNTISDNNVSNNGYGIRLSSSSNTIHGNTASNNDWGGIRLSSRSSNNLIYNNYFNNKNNARDDGNNTWNITKISGTNIIGGSWQGGNYWSDYAGIDANGDGLGDTLLPYNSNGDILVGGDMHPLVPAGIAPLLSVEKTDDPDPVQAGGTLNYSISVSNKGYINASAVTVTEIYDVNVTFDSAIPAPSSGNDMWIFPALNANETKLIKISVTVNPLTAMGTVLHNTVDVSCAEGVTGSDTEATTVFSGEPNCTCGDICVITTGWWRNGSAFHPTDTPIQAAIDNATAGETICVKDGTYTENVGVDKQLTIRSENGAAPTTVNVLYSNDHVFEVTAGYVSISGFSVKGATGDGKAGIWLDNNIEHCNISDNNALENNNGIYMTGSSNYNTITGNTVSNNARCGIYLPESSNYNSISSNIAVNNGNGICISSSSGNKIYNNTVSNNGYSIRLYSSNSNTISDNTISSNIYGIHLDFSSDNTISNNTASNNNGPGIGLSSSSDNTISSNIVFNNNKGISLSSSSSNRITNNSASNNNYGGICLRMSGDNRIANNSASSNNYGIRLDESNNNLIYNNYFNNTNNAWDDGSNVWNIAKTAGTNIIGGSWLGGNYWSDYEGIDANGDGLGDTLLPYNSNGDILMGGDMHPLVTVGYAPLLSIEKSVMS